jgi:hypothetical protein
VQAIYNADDVFAFTASEVTEGVDLNGDGSTQAGIFYYRRSTDIITFTGVASHRIRGVSDEVILFVVPESDLNEDYNGDGQIDGEDYIPAAYDLTTGEVTYLRMPPLRRLFYDRAWVRLSGSRVVAVLNDRPEIVYYELTTGELVVTPARGYDPVIDREVIAYRTAGSGTISYYNIAAGVIVDTGITPHVEELSVEAQLIVRDGRIVFLNNEEQLNQDLNGDGQLSDSVVGVYDIATGELQYLPEGGLVFHGNRFFFAGHEAGADRTGDGETDDFFLGVYDLDTNTTAYIETPTRFQPRTILGTEVAVEVDEGHLDEDLNGDSVVSDEMLALVTIQTDTTKPTITVAFPTASTYLLKQRVIADYTCRDEPSGSGIASCTGKVPDGSRIGTNTVGFKTFWVQATDTAGNLRRTSVHYTVAYGICTSFDQSRQYESWRTLAITVRLCDASGQNVSSADVPIEVVGLSRGGVPDGASDMFGYEAVIDNTANGGAYTYQLPLGELSAGGHVLSFTAGSDPSVHTLRIRVVADDTPNS